VMKDSAEARGIEECMETRKFSAEGRERVKNRQREGGRAKTAWDQWSLGPGGKPGCVPNNKDGLTLTDWQRKALGCALWSDKCEIDGVRAKTLHGVQRPQRREVGQRRSQFAWSDHFETIEYSLGKCRGEGRTWDREIRKRAVTCSDAKREQGKREGTAPNLGQRETPRDTQNKGEAAGKA